MPEVAKAIPQGKSGDAPYFISVKEAANILKLTPKTVFAMLDRNSKIPRRYFGRAIRIPFREFIDWTNLQTKPKRK